MEAFPASQKFPERHPVRLITHGASVVNGAQTVRSVIDAAQQAEDAELAQVTVRFIVTGGDAEFANRTTRATNRQNHITERDRIALEPVQAQLIAEFRAELGLVYSVRRSELEPQDDEGCSVVEAACALACAHTGSRFAARLVASGSTDVLWERGGSGIHDPLFRSVPSVYETWNAVNVLRAVRTALRAEREQYEAPTWCSGSCSLRTPAWGSRTSHRHGPLRRWRKYPISSSASSRCSYRFWTTRWVPGRVSSACAPTPRRPPTS